MPKIVAAAPSEPLKQATDSTPLTTKKQMDIKKTLSILLLLLASAACVAQTHFPENFNVDMVGGINDVGNYTPVASIGYTFNNWK
jgi:hypothetical protein